MMENFIVGGGLAGLIYAYYNKDFKILTDRIGGQSTTGFELGPRLIQKHEMTTKLLADLGFKNFIKYHDYNMMRHAKPMIENVAGIGYYEQGNISDNASDDFRLKYYIKSRCLTGDTIEVPETVMSENKISIDYYEITHAKLAGLLAEKLKKEQRIFLGKVQQVHIDDKLINFTPNDGDTKTLGFNKIVNTAPFPFFFKMCNPLAELNDGFEFEPKYFIVADKHDFWQYMGRTDHDYVYFADDDIPWHRITMGKTECIIECTGEEQYSKFAEKYKKYDWHCEHLKVGQIKQSYDSLNITTENGTGPQHVRMLGRYAQWNHEIKTQQVVESAVRGLW